MLKIVQRFCSRTGLDVPTSVLGNTDSQVRQILALLEEEGNDLATRGDWQELTNEAIHVTVATESQGAIKTIASNGFSYIKNQTIWDRGSSLPVYVINGSDWQQSKAINLSGPRYQARFRGGNLIVNPVPVAGLTWAFEYISENWVTDSTDANPDKFFNDDTDKVILPENLVLLGLRWRFLKEKGLEYAEQFATYEKSVENSLSRDNMRRVISMSQRPSTPKPRIYIPESWDI